jgi:hypothetical protein
MPFADGGVGVNTLSSIFQSSATLAREMLMWDIARIQGVYWVQRI